MKAKITLLFALAMRLSSPATDFWISPKQDHTNRFESGTYGVLVEGKDPGQSPESAYYGDFDAIIASLPPGSNAIHLLPGTFLTKGDTNHLETKWKANTRLMGSGMSATTIRVKSFPLRSRTTAIRVVRTNSNFSVSDLAIEFEYGDQKPRQGTVGASLSGDHSRVSRVLVRSIFGSFKSGAADGEGFGVIVGSDMNSKGGLVKDTSVLDSVGDYVSAIITMGEASVIGNHVEFPEITPPGYDYFKFQGYCPVNAVNTTIADNYQYGGLAGVWQDTGSTMNLLISGNHFKRTQNGILFISSADANRFSNIWVTNNRFEMTSKGSGVRATAGSPARLDRLVVSNNLFLTQGSETAIPISYAIILGHPNGELPGAIYDWSVFGNTVPPQAPYSIWTVGHGDVYDNTDYTGSSLAGVWNEKNQTAALPMSKYNVGTVTSTFHLTKEQAMVVITGTTTVTNNMIVLPEAGENGGWTYPGRELVIVNTSSKPILVKAFNGMEKINDSGADKGSISLDVDRLARFISVDNRKWYLAK